MHKIKDVLDNGLCLGCGLCGIDDSIEMKYSHKLGQYIPILPENEKTIDSNIFDICPGKGYEIKRMSRSLYNINNNSYSVELGYVNNQYVAHSVNEQVLNNASSGGIITQIILYLLEKKIVDKAVVTKFVYTKNGPRAKAIITDSTIEILESQGSKYCPVDMSEVIKKLKYSKDKIVFVGTPCQIAGLRKIQKYYISFKKNIVLTISNFCGGIKNYNNVNILARRNKIDYRSISYFRFRGGGQPGSMIMKDQKSEVSIEYPRYTGQTGISKHLRCHLCVDATGELADISCGDAWISRYLKNKYPWSIIITRTQFASDIIKDMIKDNKIVSKDISKEEIIESQKQNITSKKYRQKARMKLYSFFGYSIPNFYGGYRDTITSIKTEVTVFFKHRLLSFLEWAGIYWWLRKLMRK